MSSHAKQGPFDSRRKIAVIGSGISGLSAAWLLSRTADVTLYDREARPGGHSNTVEVAGPDGIVAVDTGFIVYNERNYPNLAALFRELDVPTQESDMSFSASLDNGSFEYSGSGISGLLGQRINVLRPRFWSMVKDILRFYREAPLMLGRPETGCLTLGEFLERENYSRRFVEDHLLPMGAAIWSTKASDMRAYPLEGFLRFFVNHGLLLLKDRPKWRTVRGGSREYVKRMLDDFRGEIRLGSPVVDVRRDDRGATVVCADGQSDRFNHVVIATHADQALAMLSDADERERRILGAFDYTQNIAVLHSDPDLMPRRRSVWASWNYLSGTGRDESRALSVTYWMNRLQNLGPRLPLFLTLNPPTKIEEEKFHHTIGYTHPLFDAKAIAAQKQLWQLQGRRHTWFCGAHFGSGFHEDGLQSGLAVAEQLGGARRPWTVEDESGRIFLDEQRMAAE